MNFNAIDDLDGYELYSRAETEAKLIHSKPSTRRGRSLEDIIETVLYGHAAELYLIKHRGFSDDPRPFKDVIDTQNDPVEVKVTEGDYYVPYVLERANKAASESWRQYPNWLYIFIGDKSSCDYQLHGIYLWNGKEFCLHSKNYVV